MRARAGLRAVAVAVMAAGGVGCGLIQRRPVAPPPVILVQPPIILQAPQPAPEMAPPVTVVGDPAAPIIVPDTAELPPAAPPKALPKHSAETPVAKPPIRPPAADSGNDSPAPQLTTALTPAEQARARRDTTAILTAAQRDLGTLARRKLTGDAAATRAQASEYVRQSQEALRQGDLVRAENLAQKAQTLIRFLLGAGI